MDIRVDLTIDQSAVRALSQPNGMTYKAVRSAADVTVSRSRRNVRAYGRVKTGFMGNSIGIKGERITDQEVSFIIASDANYSIYQHDGTRRGVTPAPFFRDALDSLSVSDFQEQP